MDLRMKNFNITGIHWKIRFLGGAFTKNQYRGANCLKKRGGGLGQFEGLRGGGLGVDTPTHTMLMMYSQYHLQLNWISLYSLNASDLLYISITIHFPKKKQSHYFKNRIDSNLHIVSTLVYHSEQIYKVRGITMDSVEN